MFNEGLLIDGDTIHSEWFMFAFLSALRAGDIAYAENFLIDCKSKINRREQENVVNHALAELALEKKDFKVSAFFTLMSFIFWTDWPRSSQSKTTFTGFPWPSSV